jgi:hypothetical protein
MVMAQTEMPFWHMLTYPEVILGKLYQGSHALGFISMIYLLKMKHRYPLDHST